MTAGPDRNSTRAASRKAAEDSAHLVADQSAVAAFLGDPATHGGQPVERIDTHAAMVFLAGARAYKIKRAVKFPYMDFSTLARRKWACEREIELNRRTAPSLYLGAFPITRTGDGRLALGSEGEAIEWAVEMQRFDQAGLFDKLAHAGALTARLMTELADTIVRFHALADPLDPETAPHAGAAGLRWVLEETLDEFGERPDLFAASDVDGLAHASRAQLSKTEARLDERLRQGFVRRCHGDLHLRNICLVDGAPTLFDCIEFNDTLACIDVLYDLAFLLMDLDHRGLRPLANLVLNRYLQQTGDLSGLGVLPLFLAARALIRAKVSASAEASQDEADRRRELRDEARAYFRRAATYLTPSPPCMIAIGGLSGTGKTTLARRLAPSVGAAPGAVNLRSDVIRKELWGAGELDRLPQEAYAPEMSDRVYATILARAEEVLAGGYAVVADAVYAKPRERDDLDGLARRLDIPFRGLWLSARADRLIERVEQRTEDASDATETVVRRQLGYDTGPIRWQRLDAAGTELQVLEAAQAVLEV